MSRCAAQLNDDVLPSAVGTGGPVIGVDGLPSNVDHTWVHYKDVRAPSPSCSSVRWFVCCLFGIRGWFCRLRGWFGRSVCAGNDGELTMGCAQAFSYACNPDILGCETGLEVDPVYAWD